MWQRFRFDWNRMLIHTNVARHHYRSWVGLFKRTNIINCYEHRNTCPHWHGRALYGNAYIHSGCVRCLYCFNRPHWNTRDTCENKTTIIRPSRNNEMADDDEVWKSIVDKSERSRVKHFHEQKMKKQNYPNRRRKKSPRWTSATDHWCI